MSETERASFSGKMGFILATAASAVGLGNLWRFPWMVSHYGGGLFVIIYIAIAVTFGLFLMMTEVSLGRRTGKSVFSAFAEISNKYKIIQYLLAIVPMIIVPYYCVIGGWVTKWFAESTLGNLEMLAADGGAFWANFITGNTGEWFMGPSFWFLIFALMCIICILVGVEKGIEKLSVILMPLLLAFIIGITIYEFMTVPNIMDGVVYYLQPDISELSADTFLGAVGQTFYSLSIAMGILVTYGSYTKKHVDIEKSSLAIVGIDTGVAILAGLMIIPLAFCGGYPDSQGTGLMFCVLPNIFLTMPAGNIIAPIFYLLVIFAAMTSAISLAEATTSIFMDGMKKKRMPSVGITSAIIIVLGLVVVFGMPGGPLSIVTPLGDNWLDILDTLTNKILMPIGAILICVFIGYVAKTSFIEEEIASSSKFRLRPLYGPMIKIVCPILLTVILITGVAGLFLQ